MIGPVSPGQRVRGTQSAATHNTLLDVARDYRASRGKTPGLNLNGPDSVFPATELFAYQSETDEPIQAYAPVVLEWEEGIDGLGADPEGLNPAAYMGRPIVKANSPTSSDSGKAVGIAVRTFESRFGKVWSTGYCLANVHINSSGHRSARLGTSATELESDAAGPVRIAWMPEEDTERGDDEADIRLCLVQLGGGGGTSTDSSFWGEITGSVVNDDAVTVYSWRKVELSDGGTWTAADPEVTGEENLYRVPSNGTPPDIPPGQQVRIWPSPTVEGAYECPAVGGLQTVTFLTQEDTWDSLTCLMTTRTYQNSITGRDLKIGDRVEIT